MKYLKLMLVTISLCATSFASANPGAWMPAAKKISSIIVEGNDNGLALIIIEGGVPSEYIPAECRAGGDSAYNTAYLNTSKGRGIYSMALAAYIAGKPVRLALSCAGNRPLITHIQLL